VSARKLKAVQPLRLLPSSDPSGARY